jgi:predicted RNase H-like HicB family nuclease
MPVHDQVLSTARRLCRERGGWTFRLDEVVRALPHLNASTVRTHIVSRCCVNAPAHHLHRWRYFRRVGRGRYEILPAYRRGAPARRAAGASVAAGAGSAAAAGAVAMEGAGPAAGATKPRVAEARGTYGSWSAAAPRDTVHAVVTRSRGWYVAECLEVAVVTQGHTLDELVANLGEAIGLHLEGGDAARHGLVRAPRIALTYEIAPRTA